MWTSKDIAFITILSAVSFVYSMLIGQLGNLLTGIQGLNYLLTIGHAIFISFGFLAYEGRRWRFFLQTTIVVLLFIPTYAAGKPFDVLARMPLIVVGFVCDLFLNSFYGHFKRNNKFLWWSIITATVFMVINPLAISINMFLFYTPEVFSGFFSLMFLMLPVIIIESIIGGYISHRIYIRVFKHKSELS